MKRRIRSWLYRLFGYCGASILRRGGSVTYCNSPANHTEWHATWKGKTGMFTWANNVTEEPPL